MEVKGSAVRTIPDYIRKNFPDQYEAWHNSLPEGSLKIFDDFIRSADWYPFHEGMHIPVELLGKVVFKGDTLKAAWECGRYSAESTLTGIYKFFVMAAPPSLVIRRGSRILGTFYQPVEIKVAGDGDGWAILHITKFDELTEVIENRIGGWIEKGLEIQKVKNPTVAIVKSMAKGDKVTEIKINWT